MPIRREGSRGDEKVGVSLGTCLRAVCSSVGVAPLSLRGLQAAAGAGEETKAVRVTVVSVRWPPCNAHSIGFLFVVSQKAREDRGDSKGGDKDDEKSQVPQEGQNEKAYTMISRCVHLRIRLS